MPISIPLVLVAIVSIIRIILLLCRKGSSKSLKLKILKRHFIYMILFIVYYILLLYDIDVLLEMTTKNRKLNLDLDFRSMISTSLGFFMALSRIIFEPYVI
jgi:hypothetical protein